MEVDEDLSLSDQIFSICNSLGKYERVIGSDNKVSQKYELGEECLGCLKDMKEILRYNDPTALEVYCELWRLKIIEKDLIPIILLNKDPCDSTQSSLALACIRMTWPHDLSTEIDILNEEDVDISQINRATRERVKSQYDYKVTFTQNPEILRIIHDFLKSFLLVEKRERTQKDNQNIRLLLHLFRNLVAIKDLTDYNIPRTTLQNQLIILYEKEGIFKTLFNLASDNKELSQWNTIIQEIFYHVFYDIEPQSLLKNPREEAETRAKKLLKEEQVKKSKNQNKDSRYNGSIWIKGKDLIIHKRDGMRGNGPKVLDNLKKRKYEKTLLSLLTARAMKRFDDKQMRYKAEYILNKIYYEEGYLKMMLSLAKEFKDQSFGLESCSETTFEIQEVSRTKQRSHSEMEEDPCADDHYEDVIEYVKVNRENSKEHKLAFEEFQMGLVNESIISTYCSLLEYYERIDSESLYHITTAFHRIIIRCSADTIFFKLSILELLNRISIHFEGLQKLSASQNEFKDFIRLVSESFFNYAEKNDLMYCEVFCPKTTRNWRCLKYGYDYFDISVSEK
ncbi:14795_t:CDS:10 [Gigaspora margarita]|uniref:14795_t:CDS:1 n=1 Tax=Gigaspora margarita TaxID=4874 RepID=A0ABN7VRT4_GIGMA|nr:14795_t:CDS:10 [Gigaspora margarita]